MHNFPSCQMEENWFYTFIYPKTTMNFTLHLVFQVPYMRIYIYKGSAKRTNSMYWPILTPKTNL